MANASDGGVAFRLRLDGSGDSSNNSGCLRFRALRRVPTAAAAGRAAGEAVVASDGAAAARREVGPLGTSGGMGGDEDRKVAASKR